MSYKKHHIVVSRRYLFPCARSRSSIAVTCSSDTILRVIWELISKKRIIYSRTKPDLARTLSTTVMVLSGVIDIGIAFASQTVKV